MNKRIMQIEPEQAQVKLLQRELVKQQKRHARVEARTEKAIELLNAKQHHSYGRIQHIEWQIAQLRFHEWHRTGKPDWSVLLNSKSGSYYYNLLDKLLRQLHPQFFIGGAWDATDQYCVVLYLYDTVEADESTPDIDRMESALQTIMPYIDPDNDRDMHKYMSGAIAFDVFHPESEGFALTLAIQPETGRCLLLKQAYRRVTDKTEFSSIRDALLHIKKYYARKEYRSENTVTDESLATIGASHA